MEFCLSLEIGIPTPRLYTGVAAVYSIRLVEHSVLTGHREPPWACRMEAEDPADEPQPMRMVNDGESSWQAEEPNTWSTAGSKIASQKLLRTAGEAVKSGKITLLAEGNCTQTLVLQVGGLGRANHPVPEMKLKLQKNPDYRNSDNRRTFYGSPKGGSWATSPATRWRSE